MRLTLLLLGAAALAQAQASARTAGLEPTWDIAVVLGEISANASRVLPELEKLDPQSWTAKGASETYIEQWQSSRDQVRALADGAKLLAKNPERLSSSLELFFRIEAIDQMLGSVEEGARKYQSPQAAAAVQSVYAEGGANRERWRRYIINLAADRERQFDVMDKEAQRCRATLMAPTPPKSAGRKK